MLAQGAPGVVAAPPAEASSARPRQAAPERPRPAGGARRMPFKDRHALETLPARIEALQAEIARLVGVLADPDLYTRHPARFAEATTALAAAQAKLAAAEEQWLTLEMQREAAEG